MTTNNGLLTITTASTALTLNSSANPSPSGSTVTFTVTTTQVTPHLAMPSGDVQFYTNGVALGAPVAFNGGVASVSTADLPVGTNSVAVSYAGDSDFLGSSNSLLQVVSSLPQRPSILGVRDNGDGTVTVSFAGTAGADYVVEAASELNLPTWVNVSTNTAGSDGRWTFTESSVSYPIRFYRAATQPNGE